VSAVLALSFENFLKKMFFGGEPDPVKVKEGDQPQGDIEAVVYEQTRAWSGTISAEHGIGVTKRQYLSYSRTPEEIGVMRAMKHALDPTGILNPGKILST